MSDYTLIQETRSDRLFIRAWQPGDGVTCSFARMQRGTPCAPPVAVTVTEDKREQFDFADPEIRKLVLDAEGGAS